MTPLLRIYRDAFSGIPKELWALALAALINRSGTMVLPFISLYLTAERGLSTIEAGQLVGAYGLGALFGAYLGGWLADHIGSLPAQKLSLVFAGAGYLLLAEMRSPVALAATLFTVGLITESFRPAVMLAFAERSSSSIRAKAFAFLRLAVNLGVGIGPAVGGVLAVYNYRWLFIADAVTCWIAVVVLMKVRPVRREPRRRESGGESRPPWKDGPFLGLLVLSIASTSVLFQVFSTLPLYFREHIGLIENEIGLLIALNAFLIVVFEMVLIHVVSKRDRVHVVGFGAFLLCAGYALMPYHDGVWYLAVTVAVWTIGEMLYLPILNVIVAERAGTGVQGRYMGAFTMSFAVAFIVAPVAGTAVYDHFGALALWHGIGVLGIVLWLGAMLLRPYLRESD